MTGKAQRDWKAEAVKQWDGDPCGGEKSLVFGTAEYFRSVERQRYAEYAPWLWPTIGFDNYSGKRVLEVGFGLGTDHVAFARAGALCFGIDLTPRHIRGTQQRLAAENLPVRLLQADAETLPFANECFDVVYSFGVLHHTPDTQRAIDEAYRVLRPGGQAIVGLYHRNSAFFWGGCILSNGLARGNLISHGYRETLSRIERRENSNAVPLVKVYSRRSAARLFRKFEKVNIQVRHFDFTHFGYLGPVARLLLGRYKEELSRRLGWYLVVRALKSSKK